MLIHGPIKWYNAWGDDHKKYIKWTPWTCSTILFTMWSAPPRKVILTFAPGTQNICHPLVKQAQSTQQIWITSKCRTSQWRIPPPLKWACSEALQLYTFITFCQSTSFFKSACPSEVNSGYNIFSLLSNLYQHLCASYRIVQLYVLCYMIIIVELSNTRAHSFLAV